MSNFFQGLRMFTRVLALLTLGLFLASKATVLPSEELQAFAGSFTNGATIVLAAIITGLIDIYDEEIWKRV